MQKIVKKYQKIYAKEKNQKKSGKKAENWTSGSKVARDPGNLGRRISAENTFLEPFLRF